MLKEQLKHRWQTSENNTAARDRRPQKNKGRLARVANPLRIVLQFILQCLNLARHEDSIRSDQCQSNSLGDVICPFRLYGV